MHIITSTGCRSLWIRHCERLLPWLCLPFWWDYMETFKFWKSGLGSGPLKGNPRGQVWIQSWRTLFCQADDIRQSLLPMGRAEPDERWRVTTKVLPAPAMNNQHPKAERWLLGSQPLCKMCIRRFSCSMDWTSISARMDAAAAVPSRRNHSMTGMSLMVWVIRQCSPRGTMQQAKVHQWRWWPLKQLTCPNLPVSRGPVSSLPHQYAKAPSSWGGYWQRSLEISREMLAFTGWK